MDWTSLNLSAATPEIVLLIGLFGVLLLDLWISDSNRFITHGLSIVAMLAAAGAQLAVWTSGPVTAFNGFYIADGIAQAAKLAVYLATAALFVYAKPYNQLRGIFKGEYYTLAMFACVGMSVMMSAGHFLTAYIGLELLSLSLYAAIGLRRNWTQGTEAAMKYFVLGALASGFLLYGMSMVYGATGSLDIAEIMGRVYSGMASPQVLAFGMVFLVAGLAFKLGAVPFHMWVPDVYHGAPTVATLLVASGPKLAAFALLFRLLGEAVIEMAGLWQQMLIILAVLSLGIGNIVAVAQTNLKRMLAYSTISQVGFVLLGLTGVYGGEGFPPSHEAFGNALFYMISYVLTTLGTFGLIQFLAREGFEAEEISDFAGLARRSPWLAGVMMLLMFSLAGIPPLVGFYAKLAVLKSVVAAGYTWLAVYAVLMSLIGAFYYIRVVKVMFFDKIEDDADIVVDGQARTLMAINGVAVLLLGLLPGPLMALCVAAIRSAWHLG